MIAIYKKELRSYFTSMIGFVFVALFLVVVGIYFTSYNLVGGYANFDYVLQSIGLLFIILIPTVTMRMIAEETKSKTDQLLYTSPLTIEKIVLGKYLAVYTLFLIVVAVICFYPLILGQFGNVDYPLAYANIFGFALMGAAYMAIGMFISSTTENQVIAAVLSFLVFLITYLMSYIVQVVPSDNLSAWIIFSVLNLLISVVLYTSLKNINVALIFAGAMEVILTALYLLKPSFFDGSVVKFLNWFSLFERYKAFGLGIIDFASVIYYLSLVFLFWFLTVQTIKKRRWN
ncbi:MAG: ABC transporter permease subunit [Lachnospiraceae bacterium]|nr:ABC transporter permease subunit [Lachnospiraceae bacterium]MBQ9563833.1 ABC transporter permease subunit [Lachnospiraceae bacterium]MBR0153580.1 ABC transporter permease subunit [Lachnospiraceae bacterium]